MMHLISAGYWITAMPFARFAGSLLPASTPLRGSGRFQQSGPLRSTRCREGTNLYPKVELVPLKTAFIEGDGELNVPTIEDLLGDKLTAFGPNTTGIPLNERNTMQFMKKVFDIGELFNAATDISEVHAAYEAIFAAENGYRGGRLSPEQALRDGFDTAYCMTQVGFAGAPTDGRCELIETRRRQLESHLVGTKFRREDYEDSIVQGRLPHSLDGLWNRPFGPALR